MTVFFQPQVAHRVLPLYTPLSGSWLNMAESVQRIIVRRALAGQHPRARRRSSPGWKTPLPAGIQPQHPFVWRGKRWDRRQRARQRGKTDASSALVLRFVAWAAHRFLRAQEMPDEKKGGDPDEEREER